MDLLQQAIQNIEPLDQAAMAQAKRHLQELSSSKGQLGKLAEMVVQYAGITRQERPLAPKSAIILASADHGVAKQGISAYPIETTKEMTANYLLAQGGTANAFANYSGSDLVVVDMGIAGDLSFVPGLVQRKIAYGTKDFTEGPAMTRQEAIAAVEAGIALVTERVRQGYTCFCLGEMGIGNTTASAAIVAAFTGLAPEIVTGRGTGISDSRMKVKIEVVRKALAINQIDCGDGLDVLSKIGGFEIGALAGVVLGCAANRATVVIDGLNTTAAAMIAYAISPRCQPYILSSHLSGEPAHRIALSFLGLEACVDVGVRLGEAIGASVVVDLLKGACRLFDGDWLKSAEGLSFWRQNLAAIDQSESELPSIRPLDEAAMEKCQLRLDNLTKPLGSLKAFEELGRKLAGIIGQPRPRSCDKKLILTGPCQSSDNENEFVAKFKVLQAFSKHFGAEILVCRHEEAPEFPTEQGVKQLIQAGVDFSKQAALSNEIIGIGSLELVSQELAAAKNLLARSDGQTLLPRLARLEHSQNICFLAGLILGAASYGCAVVLDDDAALAAALVAVELDSTVKDHLVASHLPFTAEATEALTQLDLSAYFSLQLTKPAGMGALLGFSLFNASLHVLSDMKTFGEAEVSVAQDGPGALRQDKAVRE
ncbi:MAG: nicotinate-nucleotide--dimethylbenzimidazole phosphoribosyltransferase [Sporomusaceae bacterium]|nr:nicotinate-nucleotide--dimethylbenzimidazole phosphoribosyltransferase [Sporomusaceae bacterium]